MDPTQLSFQEFMLGGTKKQASTPTSTISKTPSSSSKKKMKRYGPIFKAFEGRLQDWKDADDQLYQVLNSIVNLRNRIWWETKQLTRSRSNAKPWESNGYRSRNHSSLLSSDVELALSHDLLQHERMLSLARTLISSMAQAQEAMGRRIDEAFQLEETSIQAQIMLDQALQIYRFLGEELYRKQVLISKVFDSCHGGLMEENVEESWQDGNPRSVAQKCFGKWSSKGGGADGKKDNWLLVDASLGSKTNF